MIESIALGIFGSYEYECWMCTRVEACMKAACMFDNRFPVPWRAGEGTGRCSEPGGQQVLLHASLRLACPQGFLDTALVVGSFHVIERAGEEGLERAVRQVAEVAAACLAACISVLAQAQPCSVPRIS